jgi:alpha-D-ribose 1-methylphosphonate 5-triphosphate synthase subunit PhnH
MSMDLPGFADPVADAQAAFRAVLDAMARPGRSHVAGAGLKPPEPLSPATAALLLTLADMDTPLWLAPDCAPARDWIDFHCGAPVTGDPASAAIAVAAGLPDFLLFDSGTDDAPERSATLLVQVRAFGAGQPFRLAGPGLRTPETLRVDGLPEDFALRWAANHALYPRGIDLILCAGTRVVALPRSLAVDAA